MVEYKIVINKEKRNNHFQFKYGNMSSAIHLYIDKDCGVIEYSLTRRKSVSSLIEFKDKAFHDALRKLILLHALLYDYDILINEIIVYIDDEKVSLSKENDLNGNFPYMFSMIGRDALNLPNKWKSLDKIIINSKRSYIRDDKRFICLYAFLMSKNRIYFIDKFMNLWTAMNAYYEYRVQLYKNRFEKEYNILIEKWNNLAPASERDMIGSLVYEIDKKYKNLNISDANEIWRGNYDVEDALRNLSHKQIEGLYESLSRKDYNISDNLVAKIAKIADGFGLNPYSFLLLIYPYHLRCNYFHGNNTGTLIAAYNDYEISSLGVVNYFISRFLENEIPKMFDEDFWNSDKHNSMLEYMYKYSEKDSKGRSIFDKRMNNILNKDV